MGVKLTWDDMCGWKVEITWDYVYGADTVAGKKVLYFGDYKQAYFWKKYEAVLDFSFVRDYVTNL